MNLVANSGRPRPRLLVCLDLLEVNAPADEDPELTRIRIRLLNCRRVLEHARAWGWGVVHVHRRSRCDLGPSRPIRGLEPLPCEPVMTRDGFSAFSSKSFCELVAGAHEAQVVLIGFCLASSCLATLFDAHDRGLDATIVGDAVAATPLAAVCPAQAEPVVRSIAASIAAAVSTDQLVGRAPLRLVSA